jgi:hypothetical protein
VLACEGRLIAHMEIHDRLPPAQIFLASLREHVEPGTPLYTTFTPSHSERFFLQVVDGFVLSEAQLDGNSLSNGLVLMKNSAAGQWAGDLLSRAVVLARHDDYVLVRIPR